MNKEIVNTLAQIIISFATFVGAGGAIAYYLKEIQMPGNTIVTALSLYTLSAYYIIKFFERRII